MPPSAADTNDRLPCLPPLRAPMGAWPRVLEQHRKATPAVGCVLLGTVLSAIVHGFAPAGPHIEKAANHSAAAHAVGFGPLAVLYMLLAYTVLVWSLHRLARRWRAPQSRSLSLAALLLGGLQLVGKLEGVSDGQSLVDLLGRGLGDSVPVVIALGLFARLSTQQGGRSWGLPAKSASGMGTFLAVVSVAALSAWVRFGVMDIAGFHGDKTAVSTSMKVWTLALALFLGGAYAVWMKLDAHLGALERSFRFVFVLFGANWLIFNLFRPLLFAESFVDFLLYRWAFDVLAVFAGTLAAELVVWQIDAPQT